MTTGDLKAYFESKFDRSDSWNFATSEYELVKYNRQVDLIDDRVGSIDRILEIGCAEGVHSQMLLEAFPRARLLGIDLSDTAVKKCRSRVPEDRCRIVSADATEYLHEITGSFDVIVWSETLYYMAAQMAGPELHDYVESLFDILRPEGILVTANLPGQTGSPEERLTKSALMETYHELLAGVGTEVHRSQYTERKAESDSTYTYEIWAFKP